MAQTEIPDRATFIKNYLISLSIWFCKMTKKIINRKNYTSVKRVIPKSRQDNLSLEQKMTGVKIPENKEEVIEELMSELNVSDSYKRTEKKLKKELLDEEDALDLGIKPNNYYSAKEKEDEEDELGGTFEESSGSFGHRPSR